MTHTSNSTRTARRRAGVFCLLLAAGAAGCEDFITTEPRAQLVSENFFQTPEHAVQATNATYSFLRDWTVHVFSWIGLTEISSDDATKGSVPADAAFLLDIDNLNFDPGNLAFLDPWTGYFRGIYRANTAIQNIPRVSGSEAMKNRLIAENKFLRAYYYFFLARGWGGVPLLGEPLTPGQFEQPRATADEIFNLIKQDLQDAIAVLPEKSEYPAADLGRATRGAARAMLAQVHLFLGEYENAYQRATEVIGSGQYGLFANYDQIFMQVGENSSESIFEVQAVALEQGGAGSQFAQVQGVRGTPNIGWGFNTPSSELEAAYEPGDPRLQATIMYPWEQLPDGTDMVVHLNPSMPNNRYNQKAFVPPTTPGGTGNAGKNIRRIRYSDVLLIAAEAAYRTNRAAEAQNYLNQVRARARGGRSVTLGFSAEQLFSRIATDVLGLPAASSRVFVRFAREGTPAYAAGLRNFEGVCSGANNTCPSGAVPPVRVVHADIIQSVDGTPVTTLESFLTAVNTRTPGSQVNLQVLRVTQPSVGTTETQTLTVTVPAQALLPNVTATGEALLDAIWQERRTELAMEQHRWFDLMRQDRARPGHAAAMLGAHGKQFQDRHRLFPVPANEVTVAGLQQNPGY